MEKEVTENTKSNVTDRPHEAISLIGKVLLFIVFTFTYFGSSMFQGNEFFPWHWSYSFVYGSTTIVLLSIIIFLAVLATYGDLDGEAWISSFTDIDEYKDKTKFDSLLAHYTNVATVGLFITVLIFTGKKFSSDFPLIVTLVSTLIMFAVFFIYAIFYAKVVKRFAKKNELNLGIYGFLSALVLIVDAQVIEFFIASMTES